MQAEPGPRINDNLNKRQNFFVRLSTKLQRQHNSSYEPLNHTKTLIPWNISEFRIFEISGSPTFK